MSDFLNVTPETLRVFGVPAKFYLCRTDNRMVTMTNFAADKIRDEVLLLARLTLVLLFVIFGWNKMLDLSGTAAYFAHDGLPVPMGAAIIAVIMEFVVGIAILLGFMTRPLAVLLAIYTLGTALVGHQFWTMSGADFRGNEINFFKNISIIGGLLALYVAGPGRYSIDARRGGGVA
jgi:putative oxidoreductase